MRPHDRFIQELQQRVERSKRLQNDPAEPGSCHSIGWQKPHCEELLVPEEIGCRMNSREAPGHSQELFTGKVTKKPAELSRLQGAPQPDMVERNVVTYRS